MAKKPFLGSEKDAQVSEYSLKLLARKENFNCEFINICHNVYMYTKH